jgi:hypothetical protein
VTRFFFGGGAGGPRPIRNFAPRGELDPQGAKLSPRGEFCPLEVKLSPGGEVVKFVDIEHEQRHAISTYVAVNIPLYTVCTVRKNVSLNWIIFNQLVQGRCLIHGYVFLYIGTYLAGTDVTI